MQHPGGEEGNWVIRGHFYAESAAEFLGHMQQIQGHM